MARLTSADDRILELLPMLTPLEPLKRHQDVKLHHTKNAASWLLRLESFCEWRDSNAIEGGGRNFYCYGIPGAGKTVIRYSVKCTLPSGYIRQLISHDIALL